MDADTSTVTRTQHENVSLDGILYHHKLTPPKWSVAKALQRMVAAGFSVQAVAGRLRVSPADQLTPVQRQWIAANKAALVAELTATTDPHIAEIVETFGAVVMRVTPEPDPPPTVSVELPESTDTGGHYPVWESLVLAGTVRCVDCAHSVLPPDTDPVYGWRLCGLDIEGGGGFGRTQRRCEAWETAA